MAEFYIGSRNGWDTINTAVGGRVGKLNNKLSDTLRTIAMEQGIKKTQAGSKLEFYSVNKDQLSKLLDPNTPLILKLRDEIDFRPLLTVDGDKMVTGLRNVNSKPEYSRGMDYKTHCKYKYELRKALEDSVVKVNEDIKIAKEQGPSLVGNINNVKVGDVVMVKPSKYSRLSLARVTKLTNKSFWYEFILPHGQVISNIDYAQHYFKDVNVICDKMYYTHFIIPYLPNKEQFSVELDWNKCPKTGMKRWDGEEVVLGYEVKLDMGD